MKKTTKKRLLKSRNGRGRPEKIDTISFEQMKMLYLEGFTDDRIADFFGIALSTFYLWKRKHADFSEAIKSWKKEADENIERALYQRGKGYTHKAVKLFPMGGKVVKEEYLEHYPPDPSSCIFWLKNRDPKRWQDKVDHAHSGAIKLDYGHRQKEVNAANG